MISYIWPLALVGQVEMYSVLILVLRHIISVFFCAMCCFFFCSVLHDFDIMTFFEWFIFVYFLICFLNKS